jgi:hypothetical protein
LGGLGGAGRGGMRGSGGGSGGRLVMKPVSGLIRFAPYVPLMNTIRPMNEPIAAHPKVL